MRLIRWLLRVVKAVVVGVPDVDGHSSQRLKSPASKRLPKSPEEAPLSLDDSSEEFIPLTEDRPSGKPDSAVRLSKGSGKTPTGEPQQPRAYEES